MNIASYYHSPFAFHYKYVHWTCHSKRKQKNVQVIVSFFRWQFWINYKIVTVVPFQEPGKQFISYQDRKTENAWNDPPAVLESKKKPKSTANVSHICNIFILLNVCVKIRFRCFFSSYFGVQQQKPTPLYQPVVNSYQLFM